MKICVVGNCQARPLSQCIKKLGNVDVLTPVVVHLTKKQHEVDILTRLDKADIILSQFVNDAFDPQFVTTSFLKQRYIGKVLSWPNLFFSGDTPDLRYISPSTGGRILGPLGAYHNAFIFDSWLQRLSKRECLDFIMSPTLPFENTVSKSLKRLEEREDSIDIKVVSFIKEHYKNNRLFYTFNHPSISLIAYIAAEILKVIQPQDDWNVTQYLFDEQLNTIVPPVLPAVARCLDVNYPISTLSRGLSVEITNGDVTTKNEKIYELEQLVDVFYSCYNSQKEKINSGFRVTPNY